MLDRYEAVPKALINDHETNASICGTEKQIVYDILLDGEVEVSISEGWLHAMANIEHGPDESIEQLTERLLTSP